MKKHLLAVVIRLPSDLAANAFKQGIMQRFCDCNPVLTQRQSVSVVKLSSTQDATLADLTMMGIAPEGRLKFLVRGKGDTLSMIDGAELQRDGFLRPQALPVVVEYRFGKDDYYRTQFYSGLLGIA